MLEKDAAGDLQQLVVTVAGQVVTLAQGPKVSGFSRGSEQDRVYPKVSEGDTVPPSGNPKNMV